MMHLLVTSPVSSYTGHEPKFECFYTMSAHILGEKYLGQDLFKEYSKFQKLDEILYCGMTRFRNVKLHPFL